MGLLRRMLRALLACIAFAGAGAWAQTAVPPATAHVIDQTGSLDAMQSAALEGRLSAFEREHGAQVVVLIVPTTAPETIEQFGIRVAEQWRLGRQGVDDGVIVLVALQDRAARIEVGYGLEGVLTDAASHRILAEDMAPRLREGDIAGGVSAGVDRILSTLLGSHAPASAAGAERPAPARDDATAFSPYFWVVVVAIAFGGLLRRAFGPVKAAAMTAPVGALLGWLAGGSLLVVLGAAALAAVLAALGIPAWLPWGGGGGGSSFKGRGGGFGGGGASGRW